MNRPTLLSPARHRLLTLHAAALTALALGAGACSSTTLHPSARGAIRSVAVASQVETTSRSFSYEDMTSQNAGTLGVGSVLGGVIAIAASSGSRHSGETLLADAAANGFPIEALSRAIFTAELQRSGLFPLAQAGNVDATFTLAIPQYGLAYHGTFTRELTPFVAIEARLTDAGGKVLFSSKRAAQSAKALHHTFDEYHANPALLRAAWEDAARKASALLIDDLRP